MARFLYLLLLFTFILLGCNKEEVSYQEGHSFVFYPRECKSIVTAIMSLHLLNSTDAHIAGEEPVASTDALLWLVTGSDSLQRKVKPLSVYSPEVYESIMQGLTQSFPLAAHSFQIERQLSRDYDNYSARPSRSEDDPLVYLYPMPWEYRVTGLQDFRIEATTPLFGQLAGTSLNKYFSIFEFRPKQIISYRTKSLVWGYQSPNKVERIDQWLALKPMAPPAIVFRLNSVPPEVPTRVSFVSILTTTDGKELRDTTMVRLTK